MLFVIKESPGAQYLDNGQKLAEKSSPTFLRNTTPSGETSQVETAIRFQLCHHHDLRFELLQLVVLYYYTSIVYLFVVLLCLHRSTSAGDCESFASDVNTASTIFHPLRQKHRRDSKNRAQEILQVTC